MDLIMLDLLAHLSPKCWMSALFKLLTERGSPRYWSGKDFLLAGKITSWNGKYVTMASHTELVKSVLASQAIYYLTPLSIPASTLNFINKIDRAFIWSAKEHTMGAKCKVNWNLVCRPKMVDGLGWPWLELKDPTKSLHIGWYGNFLCRHHHHSGQWQEDTILICTLVWG
jgi:hypothetical protein